MKFRDHYVSGRENKTLPITFICGLSLFCSMTLNLCGENKITCHTACKMVLEQRPVLFHAISDFGDDGSWYDWCLVKWVNNDEQHNTYPGKILGFFSIHNSAYAIIQSSSDPITMEQLCENFICNFVVEDDQQTVAEIETISNPLWVYKNYGGPSNSYFCVLPKRKWGHYFGEKIPSE
jgi:hypothetical protein